MACVRIVTLLALVVVADGWDELSGAAANQRPNVIVVMTDDQGYGDLGLHGNPHVRTPNLDRFGREGIQLTRFYVSPVCAPTRASLLTGRYHYRTGVIHTSRGGAKMFGDETTVAEVLAEAGYATGIFGKWHLGDNSPMRPQDQGFTESLVHRSGGIGQTPDRPGSYFDPVLFRNGQRIQANGYCTDVFFEAASAFIRQKRERPWFVYLALNAPHTPLEIGDEYVRPYLERGLDETTARVYGMIQNVDENFGRLLELLDASGLRDNTLLIFLTDNGAQQPRFNAGLRGRKAQVYEGGIRVPCFVQWPRRWEGGRQVNRIAAHIDLLPTIVEACLGPDRSSRALDELSRPVDGVSLLGSLDDSTNHGPERMLFFQCHRGLTPRLFQNAAVVGDRWKLVLSPGSFSREDFSQDQRVVELFDLERDPAESREIGDQHPEVRDRLLSEYRGWFEDVQVERQFAAGVIHIGMPGVDEVHLCRYQDATYRAGRPTGWNVRVVETSDWELKLSRGELTGALKVDVGWQGATQRLELGSADAASRLRLEAGQGTMSVHVLDAEGERHVWTDNGTAGDVTLSRIRP